MRRARAGFTLIEALIAMALAAVVVVKLGMIMEDASRASSEQTAALTLENQAQRVLDKIAFAVMSAERDQLFPDPESPDFSTAVTFAVSLGVQDGEVVLGDPERIGSEGQQVLWRQNPGMPEERRVSWCNTLRDVMLDEIDGNLLDDNDNGLFDEPGLSFTLQGDAVTIRLCLERDRESGAVTRAVETVVTVRNS